MSLPESEPRGKRFICLFTDLLGVGGVQEAGRLIVTALAGISRSRGWPVDFLSLNDAAGAQVVPGADPRISFRGFGRNKARFTFSAARLASSVSAASEPIILAAHPHLALPAAATQMISNRLQIIAMSHGIEVWKTLPPLRRWALRKSRVVLAPSSFTAQKLIEVQGIHACKVRRLPWPLSPGFLRLTNSSGDLPVPKSFPHGRVILTVGRWMASERYKGADELIRAFAQIHSRIHESHLVIAGSGDDLPRLHALAAELRVTAKVHFLEGLSNEEIASCYAHADLFALPSTGEGFGLVFLEAMVFAKPVVGAASGGTTDIIQDGDNGLLILPHDTNQLALTLERLLQDESLRTRLGNRGAEMVRRNYAFDLFRARLEKILDDCGASAGRP